MDKLIKAGLFGQGLCPIDTPEMVKRYNDCLVQLGIEPTKLDHFEIDGIGWSPQIAEEKGDNIYLSAGVANPMAVIATPNQRHKPLYFPFTSYDRAMMAAFFQRFPQEIADITTTHCLGLDIDQELMQFRRPSDLLLVDYIIVRSLAGDLIEAVKNQKAIVGRIQGKGNSWFDPAVRQQLTDSAKAYGDLRFRKVEIPEFKFDGFSSFYTLAFGGAFVIRIGRCDKAILVLENPQDDEPDLEKAGVYRASDQALYDRLLECGIVEIPWSWYQEHPESVERMQICFTADFICARQPDIDYCSLSVAKRKKLMSHFGSEVPEYFHELELLERRLRSGSPLPKNRDLSWDLKRFLLRPKFKLKEPDKEVIWQLLCRIQPLDVLRLYTRSKNQFFELYKTWTQAKQRWAIQFLKERYIPETAILDKKGGKK